MSGSLTLRVRLDGAPKRVKLDQLDVTTTTVLQLRQRINQALSVIDYDVIYAGHNVSEETETLSTYGIESGCVLHVIKRPPRHIPDPAEPFDRSTLPALLTALQSALLNPAHQALVTKVLNNRDTLTNLIAATPGLDTDVVAQALIQSPELFINLANPDDAETLLEKHPCLAQAGLVLAATINEQVASGQHHSGGGSEHAGTYSLDQMSDDDEFDQDQDHNPDHGQQRVNITPNQLAAALAHASGGHQQQSGSARISNDFFQQAMAQAMGSVGLAAGSSRDPAAASSGSADGLGPQVLESQLQQLREMGITDDEAARQALRVAGGDLQMALHILFGDVNEML